MWNLVVGTVGRGLLGQVLRLAFPFSCYGVREYTFGKLSFDFDFGILC